MAKGLITREILEIPPRVEARLDFKKVYIKGPLGDVERDFSHAGIDLRLGNDAITIEALWPDKKERALVGTIKSHIKNMMIGVLNGFVYKLTVVFAHFPISVKVKEDKVIIENFGGERKDRIAKILGTVNVTVEGDDVLVKGVNIEDVAQTAANIQQATRIKKKDHRIFLDGIYVYEKGAGI